MKYRRLGELKVSEISMGTAALGQEYAGIEHPSKSESIRLLKTAFDSGINLFDTAPGYGSEELVGEALGKEDCYIATKVGTENIEQSVDTSLRYLRTDCLDILQIHNATVDVLNNEQVMETLFKLQEGGKVRYLGASIYTVEEAETANVDVLQVPFSILDQRMAKVSKPGMIARSVFLRGALTERIIEMPPVIQLYVSRIRTYLGCSWDELPEYALRYALSFGKFSSCLVGVRNLSELSMALDASETGPLSESLAQFSLSDPKLYNPGNWP